jgi:hypothetical protein
MRTEMDVEALLDPGARARLALRRQLHLYLDPFALFKDATRGPAHQRERALSWNRRMKWMLVPYIRRWLFIACALFLGIAPAEAMAAQYQPLSVLPATMLAVGFCIAFVVVTCASAAYLLLSRR